VLAGAFCEVILAIAVIGTAVTLFPVVKRQNEGIALGYVAGRIVEAVVIVTGIISLLSVVTLRQHSAGAAGANPASLVALGRTLVAVHDWTFLFGPGLAIGVNTLMLAYLMYRSGLVPRLIAVLGLIGGPLIFASSAAVLFGLYEQVSVWGSIAAIPVFAWEMSLAVWIIVKGFRPSAVVSLDARQRPGTGGAPALAAAAGRRDAGGPGSAGLGDLDGDVGGLDDSDREHARFQAELVGGFAAEQRHYPVWPGLDLHLSHDGIADDAGDQALEPVPRRAGHHRLALGVVGRLGQVLGQPGERHPVHGETSGRIGGRFDPSAVGPAAQGVIADAQQAGRLLDPERRHPATVTQMRPQPQMAAAFAPANSGLQAKLSLSLKWSPGLGNCVVPGPATTGPILFAQTEKGRASPH
jgi:uncharacterized protein DUF4386